MLPSVLRFAQVSSICFRELRELHYTVYRMFSQIQWRSGIGGGGFMTVRIPPSPGFPSEVYTIDYRETAPALANASMYVKCPDSSRYGGLAVGVPGEVRGLEEAHRRWGTLPWRRLVEPSVSLAKGWEVDKELGKRIPVRLSNIHSVF